MQSRDIWRIIGQAALVIVEAFVVLSVALREALLPLGVLYPGVVSVAVFVVPVLIGLLSDRLEVAVLLAELPFVGLGAIYLATFAPAWNVDLYTIGLLASRAAGAIFLLGGLGVLGWLIRRVLTGNTVSASRVAVGAQQKQ